MFVTAKTLESNVMAFIGTKVCVFFQVAKSENKNGSTKRIKGHQFYQMVHPSEKENFCFEVLCQFDEVL